MKSKQQDIPSKATRFFAFVKRHWYLWLLLFVLLASRMPQVGSGTIPFSFDHGRDALAVLSLNKAFDITLIGPSTSIPGLYFGPGWYYLLLPAALLTNGNPVSYVWLMVFILGVQIVIMYRYYGKMAATIMTGAPLWMIITTSSWNPFPMSLISILILIGLDQARKHKLLTPYTAALLGLSAGLGFHFSTASAIFYPVIIGLSLLLRRVRLTALSAVVLIGCFIIPFLPQVVFEIKHDFLEVKAVYSYLTEGRKQDAVDNDKANVVFSTVVGQLKLATLPEIWTTYPLITKTFYNAALLACLAGLFIAFRRKRVPAQWIEIGLFLIIPTFGYLFLHFSNWYVIAMAPAAVLLAAFASWQLPRPIRIVIALLFLISPFCVSARFLSEKAFLQGAGSLLPVKLKAIQLVREKSEGKPFASYQFISDIYDYSYQYLYFQQAFQGLPLPTEFSYQPGETIYVHEKPSLLRKLEHMIPKEPPAYIFFIVEKTPDTNFMDSWWNKQKFSKIINEYEISPHVTVYQALP